MAYPACINHFRTSFSPTLGCKIKRGWLASLALPFSRIEAIKGPPIPQMVIVSTWSVSSIAAKPSARRASTLPTKPSFLISCWAFSNGPFTTSPAIPNLICLFKAR